MVVSSSSSSSSSRRPPAGKRSPKHNTHVLEAVKMLAGATELHVHAFVA